MPLMFKEMHEIPSTFQKYTKYPWAFVKMHKILLFFFSPFFPFIMSPSPSHGVCSFEQNIKNGCSLSSSMAAGARPLQWRIIIFFSQPPPTLEIENQRIRDAGR